MEGWSQAAARAQWRAWPWWHVFRPEVGEDVGADGTLTLCVTHVVVRDGVPPGLPPNEATSSDAIAAAMMHVADEAAYTARMTAAEGSGSGRSPPAPCPPAVVFVLGRLENGASVSLLVHGYTPWVRVLLPADVPPYEHVHYVNALRASAAYWGAHLVAADAEELLPTFGGWQPAGGTDAASTQPCACVTLRFASVCEASRMQEVWRSKRLGGLRVRGAVGGEWMPTLTDTRTTWEQKFKMDGGVMAVYVGAPRDGRLSSPPPTATRDDVIEQSWVHVTSAVRRRDSHCTIAQMEFDVPWRTTGGACSLTGLPQRADVANHVLASMDMEGLSHDTLFPDVCKGDRAVALGTTFARAADVVATLTSVMVVRCPDLVAAHAATAGVWQLDDRHRSGDVLWCIAVPSARDLYEVHAELHRYAGDNWYVGYNNKGFDDAFAWDEYAALFVPPDARFSEGVATVLRRAAAARLVAAGVLPSDPNAGLVSLPTLVRAAYHSRFDKLREWLETVRRRGVGVYGYDAEFTPAAVAAHGMPAVWGNTVRRPPGGAPPLEGGLGFRLESYIKDLMSDEWKADKAAARLVEQRAKAAAGKAAGYQEGSGKKRRRTTCLTRTAKRPRATPAAVSAFLARTWPPSVCQKEEEEEANEEGSSSGSSSDSDAAEEPCTAAQEEDVDAEAQERTRAAILRSLERWRASQARVRTYRAAGAPYAEARVAFLRTHLAAEVPGALPRGGVVQPVAPLSALLRRMTKEQVEAFWADPALPPGARAVYEAATARGPRTGFHLGWFPLEPARLAEVKVQSSSMNDNKLTYITASGVVNFDVMQYLKTSGRDKSLKLADQARGILGDAAAVQKLADVAYTDISDAFAEPADAYVAVTPALRASAAALDDVRTRTLIYCGRDTVLPLRIMAHPSKLLVLLSVELARVSGTPLVLILNAGQQIRTYNNIARSVHRRYAIAWQAADLGGGVLVTEGEDVKDDEDDEGAAAAGLGIEEVDRAAVHDPDERATVSRRPEARPWVTVHHVPGMGAPRTLAGPSSGGALTDEARTAAPAGAAAFLSSVKRKALYDGAQVLDAMKGFYKEFVIIVDFASLYPSIIMGKNLSPDTLLAGDRAAAAAAIARTTNPDAYADVWIALHLYQGDAVRVKEFGFVQHVMGVVPEMLMNVLDARKRAKAEMEAATSDAIRTVQNQRQNALKITANSTYGAMGAVNGMYSCMPVAAAITTFGRTWLHKARDIVLEDTQARVLYGDTDSLFVAYPAGMPLEEASARATAAAARVTAHLHAVLDGELARAQAYWAAAVAARGPLETWWRGPTPRALRTPLIKNYIKLALDNMISNFLLLAKKKYAFLEYTPDGKGGWKSKPKTKGLCTVRRDHCALENAVVNDLLAVVHGGGAEADLVRVAADAIARVEGGTAPLDDYVLSKSLAGAYDGKQMHAEAWHRMLERGDPDPPIQGTRMHFVITACEGGVRVPSLRNSKKYARTEHPEYVKKHNLPLDRVHYLEAMRAGVLDLLAFTSVRAEVMALFDAAEARLSPEEAAAQERAAKRQRAAEAKVDMQQQQKAVMVPPPPSLARPTASGLLAGLRMPPLPVTRKKT